MQFPLYRCNLVLLCNKSQSNVHLQTVPPFSSRHTNQDQLIEPMGGTTGRQTNWSYSEFTIDCHGGYVHLLYTVMVQTNMRKIIEIDFFNTWTQTDVWRRRMNVNLREKLYCPNWMTEDLDRRLWSLSQCRSTASCSISGEKCAIVKFTLNTLNR